MKVSSSVITNNMKRHSCIFKKLFSIHHMHMSVLFFFCLSPLDFLLALIILLFFFVFSADFIPAFSICCLSAIRHLPKQHSPGLIPILSRVLLAAVAPMLKWETASNTSNNCSWVGVRKCCSIQFKRYYSFGQVISLVCH